MNPKALKALVDQQSQEPDLGPMVGGGMQASPDDVDDEDDGGDDDEPQADPLERGTELLAQWGDQGEALKESAGEIVDSAHDVGGDLLLATVPEETTEEVEDQYNSMPDDLKVTIAQHVADLDDADLTALATALINGNDGDTETPDVKLVAAYLKGIGGFAKEDVDPADFVTDEDEDDEDEDEDDADDAGDGAAAATAGEVPGNATSASAKPAPSGPLA